MLEDSRDFFNRAGALEGNETDPAAEVTYDDEDVGVTVDVIADVSISILNGLLATPCSKVASVRSAKDGDVDKSATLIQRGSIWNTFEPSNGVNNNN